MLLGRSHEPVSVPLLELCAFRVSNDLLKVPQGRPASYGQPVPAATARSSYCSLVPVQESQGPRQGPRKPPRQQGQPSLRPHELQSWELGRNGKRRGVRQPDQKEAHVGEGV